MMKLTRSIERLNSDPQPFGKSLRPAESYIVISALQVEVREGDNILLYFDRLGVEDRTIGGAVLPPL
jgi:hypothetical protein